jgi:hypothetical protein
MSDDIVRASEIGEYVHCERAWWLGHVQGVENANHAVMDAGIAQHQAHGRRVWGAQFMQNAALWLIAIAIGAAILLGLKLAQVW